MEFRKNVDDLMAEVKISGVLHRAILEGNPANRKQPGSRRKPAWRQAAVPAAAVVLIMSTMYVGAGYLMEHTPLRDIFTARDDSVLSVPEGQRRTDIYGEILDSYYSDRESRTEATDTGADGSACGETAGSPGKYGELLIDNEFFSIELLETTCAGRELTASYILTKKTDRIVSVQVNIDNDYLGQWRDGLAGETYDTDKTLLRSGFGDSFRWNKLPEGWGYQLEENQELCIITQLGKKPYASGTYTLYADACLREDISGMGAGAVAGTEVEMEEEAGTGTRIDIEAGIKTERETGEETAETEPTFVMLEDEVEEYHDRATLSLIGNAGYGLELNGATDMTEEQVHFDRYEIYISPMTVYLSLDGTYEGEIFAIWGMQRSHDITIGFADGTQTTAKVLLSGMGYGFGEIDADMHASFGTAIDPASVVSVMLDDIMILGE